MSGGGTQTTVTQAADPWYKGQASGLYNQGVDYLNRTPYSPYPGQQVAGFQPMQLAAQDFLSQQLLGRSMPYAAPQTYGPYQSNTPTFNQYTAPSGGTANPRTGYTPGDGSGDTGRDAKPRGPDTAAYTQAPLLGYGGFPAYGPSGPFQYNATGGAPGPALGGGQPQEYWDSLMRGDSPEAQAAYQQFLNNSMGPYRGFGSYATVVDPATGNQTQTNTYYNTDQAAIDAWRAGGMQGLPPGAQPYGTQVGTADSGGQYTWQQMQQMSGLGGGGGMYPPTPQPPPASGLPPMAPPTPQPPGGSPGRPGSGGAAGGPGTGLNEAQQAADVAWRIATGAGGAYPMVNPWNAYAERIGAPQAGYGGDVGANLISGLGAGYGGDVGAERVNAGMPVMARDVATGSPIDAMLGYRDPYENQVVGQALSDIDRSRQLATQDVRSQATLAGAFGGDRAAILEAETNRAYADQAARTSAQLRSQGFDRAASLAQQDAERGLRGGMANQGASLQAGLANQQAGLEAGRLNQGASLQAGLANQAQRQQFGQFNAGLGLDAQRSNQAVQMQASLANQGKRQELAEFNASLGMDAAQANQAAAAQISLANQRTGLEADVANQNAWFTGGNQQLQGAGLLSSLGGDIFGRTLGTAQALSGVGAEQQGMAQDVIGADMAQYAAAQNDPYQRFAWLQGLLSGVPQSMSQTSYVPGNRGAGFLGGALGGAGAGAAFGPWGAGIGAGLGGLLGLF